MKFLKMVIVGGTAALAMAGQPVRGQQAAGESHGVVVGNMDTAVKAGDDFFRYCNGAWLRKTEIPADRPSVSVFATLVDKSSQRVRGLIDEAVAANAPAGTNTRKIADLYKSFMDEAGIEAKGMAPLQPHLQEIAALKDKKALAFALGKTLRADVDALNNTNFHTANLFGLWVAPGFNDSEHYSAYLMQGGLQLPDREYYTGQSERMKNLRTAYQAHVAAMLKLAGFSDADARAARIVALEHAIAEKHLTLAENENVHNANNPWKRTEFAAKAPGLDWDEYFRGAGLEKHENFIVWQPGAFAGESALVASEPLEAWKDLLAYHVIRRMAACCRRRSRMNGSRFSGRPCRGRRNNVRGGRGRWRR